MRGSILEKRWLLSANGPVTSVAFGVLAASASTAAIAALRSGESSLPSDALKTTCRTAPLRSPNLALRTSVAFWASEPGITNLFSSVPLSGPNARNESTMKKARPPKTVRFGWLACVRASLASPPVTCC